MSQGILPIPIAAPTITLSILLLTVTQLFAQQQDVAFIAQVKGFPDPRANPVRCRRPAGATVSVCQDSSDTVQIITETKANELDLLANAIAQKGPCFCPSDCASRGVTPGPTIGIALVQQIKTSISGQSGDRAVLSLAQTFAYNLLYANWRNWISQSSTTCNDGILIFYSKADRVVYISVGQEISSALSTNLLSEILIDSRLLFKSSDGEGLQYLLDSLKDYLVGGVYHARESGRVIYANSASQLGMQGGRIAGQVQSSASHLPASMLSAFSGLLLTLLAIFALR